MELKERFSKIVGSEFVADGTSERYIYSFDMTENSPRQPLMIVMPSTVQEVQKIIELAK